MNIEDLTIKEAREIASMFGQSPPLPASAHSLPASAHPMIGRHCVIRTYSDGVHLGTVAKVDGMEVLLTGARRIWIWKGAFTLSEVATLGIDKQSRLAVEVPEVYLTQVISFTPTSEQARKTYENCGVEK